MCLLGFFAPLSAVPSIPMFFVFFTSDPFGIFGTLIHLASSRSAIGVPNLSSSLQLFFRDTKIWRIPEALLMSSGCAGHVG